MKKNDSLFNRELSWIEFNYRVLEEALDKTNPLLERLKFISIFSNNLDEFIMVRVAGLVSQVRSGYPLKDSSGIYPEECLKIISSRLHELIKIQYDCFNNQIIKELEKNNIFIYNKDTIPEIYIQNLREKFVKKYFLMLTPMAIDQSHPFPFIQGKTLNLLIKLEDTKKGEFQYAIIPIPGKDRFVEIDDFGNKENEPNCKKVIFIGELIKLFAVYFFRGYKIIDSSIFRITRDAELEIDEEGSEDLLSTMEVELKKRDRREPIRIEIEENADSDILDLLKKNVDFYNGFFFKITGPVDLSSFMQIALMKGFDNLKDKPLIPVLSKDFSDPDENIFEIISKKDRMINLPYESFDPVIRFIETAANDPKVLAIKQTLYRTSGDSPIISALKKAAENGKQVTVVVELKARFDEAQNISWAKQLEEVGCHVIYGLMGLKIHSKIALVVRDEEDGIKRYIHLSTGNYNDKTAKIYTDVGIFTSRYAFGRDASDIFNVLTGYSEPPRWKKLVTAPLELRDFFLELINLEINNVHNGGEGKIIAKMNSLVDTKLIEALYNASKAGVKIDLIVRGMCCLIPGKKDLSENIKVISIVDRFLEHSRVFYFYNAGNEDIFIASADWMERNFDKRIEILFPIEDKDIKKEIMSVMKLTLSDNVKSRILESDGNYKKIKSEKSKIVQSQIEQYNYFKNKNINHNKNDIKFIPRKNPIGEQSIINK